ncbi:MAG: sulfur carrier protein ThiS [Gammaproteobacteria bacterium]|nr:sulfur carrier protein ThiS [Gammaproteobacteria bacterium]MDE0252011.1 sulfur carrier protein ThiS [Gammaproteobacteria bacterium]MDE0402881.1 sulfur carrier protein ThiS [Gammaproteobacteria bacterium]
MQINVNGQEQTVESITLRAILEELGYDEDDSVVAVNCEFVPKVQWNDRNIHPNDTLDVLAPMVGG